MKIAFELFLYLKMVIEMIFLPITDLSRYFLNFPNVYK